MKLIDKIIFFSFLLVGGIFTSFSQNNNEIYVNQIDTIDLKQHLTLLASDDFDGRMTGTNGQQKAANYIRNEFSKMGCETVGDSFYQPFKLYEDNRSGSISFNNKQLNFPKDFGFFNLRETYSFDISDFRFIDKIDLENDYSASYLVLEQEDLSSLDAIDFKNIKCKGFIIILTNYDSRYFSFKMDDLALGQDSISLPIIYLNQKSIPSKFMKEYKKNKSVSLNITGTLNSNPSFVNTENVLGLVEGSDSILKNEVIVISAHYDHLGSKNGEIFYGADDNGSGTAALIELASAFQLAKVNGHQPKRSILFIAFTGEELGLLGSTYYTNHPLIPLGNTVANFNIDMIGRKTELYENDSLLMVYIIGANRLSLELDSIIKLNNSRYTNLILDEKFNALNEPQNLYYRSDHYNFAKNDIPSCFFFGGFHADYHQPTDTIEKISFVKISQIASLVFQSVWMIADSPNRLKMN